ncbi:hypothetical protein LUZ60_013415 [Juncus effusus]|nr:hypothetical protein LUZ60_013415 [Juncus effusus]
MPLQLVPHALDIVRRTDSCGVEKDEIYQSLIKAKYTEWELTSSERSWRLQNLKEACESALIEQNFLDEGFGNNNNNNNNSPNILSQQLEKLNDVFHKASEADTPTDVPDFLCCKITFDIFTDPVITPSGITYERSALLEHLKKVGRFDPITRQPLLEWQLVPNLAIKGAVQAYLSKYGWAYKMA